MKKNNLSNNITVHCSNCGMAYWDSLRKIINAGWRTFGGAAYCPRCAKTWYERNSEDKQLNDAAMSAITIYEKFGKK